MTRLGLEFTVRVLGLLRVRVKGLTLHHNPSGSFELRVRSIRAIKV